MDAGEVERHEEGNEKKKELFSKWQQFPVWSLGTEQKRIFARRLRNFFFGASIKPENNRAGNVQFFFFICEFKLVQLLLFFFEILLLLI